MSLQDIKLPEIGEGVNEGELVCWMVQPGNEVEVDQALAELMTDKATVEIPSPISGTVKELKFSEGDIIEVGQTLMIIETNQMSQSETKESHQNEAISSLQDTSQENSSKKNIVTEESESSSSDHHVLATPSTRRLAREGHVGIENLKGTGLAGRVTREDVLEAIHKAEPSSVKTPTPTETDSFQKDLSGTGSPGQNHARGKEERIPLRGIRKKIAENMQMAKRIIPHFTLMDEANVTSLVRLRQELKSVAEEMGVKLTYMPFVMKALMITMNEFPKFNAMIDETAREIVYKKYFNIGFAADTPKGLLVPVIKNANQKTIYQISQEITSLATKARQGQLSVDEMKGATFTITNIGSLGGTYATPIINHPEVAIFGMYKIQERPVLKEGKLDMANFMNFTVTCDHRLIDGAEAARFLSAFLARIKSPGRLLMDMI